MEWYKFDIAAYKQATQGIDLRDDAVYRRLLDLYYSLEGPLINDLQWLKHELKIGDRWGHHSLITVLSRYFILDTSTNHYHNQKADKEIADYKVRQGKNRDNANVRWNGANRNAIGNATAMPIQTNKQTNSAQRCCSKSNEGKDCGQPSVFWNKDGSKGHCREHGPL